MQWFRLYDEVLDDPKVQRLPPDLFKTWVNLLCLAARHGGRLPEQTAIGFALRLNERAAAIKIDALVEAGLIDREQDGTFTPHNWNGRQFTSDNVTERVRKHREKHPKAVSGNDARNVSPPLHETPPESEAESEQTPPIVPPIGAVRVRLDFEIWWKAYPNRVNKPAASRAYLLARERGPSTEQLLAGVQRYIAAKPADQHWLNPDKWLDGCRWLDEAEPAKANGHAPPTKVSEEEKWKAIAWKVKRLITPRPSYSEVQECLRRNLITAEEAAAAS